MSKIKTGTVRKVKFIRR